MNEELKSGITKVCAIIAALTLLYNICGDIFIKGMSIPEVFFKDPVTYLTTFIPFAAGLLLSVTNKAKRVNIGRISMGTCVEYLVGTLILFLEVIVRLWVIIHYSMITGWNFLVDNQYFIGLVLLFVIAAIEAAIYSSFDPDEFLDTFFMFIAVNWIILSAVNGYSQACIVSQTIPKGNSVHFIMLFLCYGMLYMIWYIIFFIVSVPLKLFGKI